MLMIVGMSVVTFSPGQPSGLLVELVLEVVDADGPQLGSAEIEQLVPLLRSRAQEQVGLVEAVEMVLVGPVAQLDALEQLRR